MEKKPNLYLSEYPRPQLVRDSYICLNGEWDYAIRKEEDFPNEFDGQILVPFSPETPASGVNKIVHPDEWLFYKKSVTLPVNFVLDKVFLHFGAVDQIAEVFIDDKLVIKHVGGYLPFKVDIKPFIENRNFTIKVRVKDYSDTSFYSRGKQTLDPHGIWYHSQSGIYMPVWLESVSEGYIEDVKFTPDIDNDILKISVKSSKSSVHIELMDIKKDIPTNKDVEIKLSNYECWDVDNPKLYDIKLSTSKDVVKSYFAMRKFSLIEHNGHKVIALNNKPLFIKGVLDQGYWTKGFLTPTCDNDYIKDIELTKSLGFNMMRKHIKIESLRYYYHCDRLGMIVWQDFINGGGKYRFPTIAFPLITGHHKKDNNYKKFGRESLEGRNYSLEEFKGIVDYLYNVSSIGLWTIFNEGWGQFDAVKVYDEMKKLDSSRLFDHASGWHDQGVSDVKSLHVYFKRVKAPSKKKIKDRALILSEAGGYSLPIEGHLYLDKSFGYKKLRSSKELLDEYRTFVDKDILRNIPKGLCAFVYTELSDVETETNGFITYDREVEKVEPKLIKEINDKVTF